MLRFREKGPPPCGGKERSPPSISYRSRTPGQPDCYRRSRAPIQGSAHMTSQKSTVSRVSAHRRHGLARRHGLTTLPAAMPAPSPPTRWHRHSLKALTWHHGRRLAGSRAPSRWEQALLKDQRPFSSRTRVIQHLPRRMCQRFIEFSANEIGSLPPPLLCTGTDPVITYQPGQELCSQLKRGVSCWIHTPTRSESLPLRHLNARGHGRTTATRPDHCYSAARLAGSRGTLD